MARGSRRGPPRATDAVVSDAAAPNADLERLRRRVAELEDERARLLRGALQLEPLLAVAPNMLIRFDRSLRITYMNRVVAPLTLEQVIGRPLADFMPASSFAVAAPVIERTLATGEPGRYDIDGQGPDHTVAQYQTDVIAIEERDGTRSGCLSTTDVTVMKRRERDVAEREALLKQALDATGMGLWIWEVDRNRVIWDERMTALTGYATPADLSAYTNGIVHPDDRATVAADGPRLLAGEPLQRIHRIVRPDGEERWVMVIARMTFDTGGSPRLAVGGLLDVTAQRRLEDELRHVHRLNAVGTLTAGVAHNFNNLLTVILPSLELVRGAVPATTVPIVDDAMGAATRAAELVQQLMTYAGKRAPRAPSACDVAVVTERCLAVCARTLGGGIQVECRVPAGLPAVHGDATDVEQVLLNLLFNARDALLSSAREPRRIVIEAGAAPIEGRAHVSLRITDNGVGMDKETLQRACEPFFTTKPVGAGTGLGLATSMAVARELGGKLELASQAGAGTTATLWLPTSTVAAQASPAPPPVERRPTAVLIVDDDPLVRRATARLLELKGNRVVSVETRERMRAALAHERFDVILLDRSLAAGAEGALVQQVRAQAPDARLLFFTGDSLSEGEAALVDGVVKKPVSTEQLLRALTPAHPGR